MYDQSYSEVDIRPRQLNKLESNPRAAGASGTAQLAGKRVKVNLYRRGIFRSCVVGICSVSPLGVTISAETALTQQRRCLSHFELTAEDVAAMRPLRSREADFDLRLELDCVAWQERVEKLPLPRARRSISRKRFEHDHLSQDASLVSGEP